MIFAMFLLYKQLFAGLRGLYYLQNTLLHREAHEEGAPRPVGRFGQRCGAKVGAKGAISCPILHRFSVDFRWISAQTSPWITL